MKVRIKKLNAKAVLPYRAHATDAGYDLVATSKSCDEYVVYGTGLAFEVPEGFAGFVFPRSSNCKTSLVLTNSVGVVDSGYRGEVMAKFGDYRVGKTYEIGDRIAQLIIMPVPNVEFEEAIDLSDSDRGEGGYGSSGR